MLFYVMLVRKTLIHMMLSKLPARGEMAELSELAGENCRLQKASGIKQSSNKMQGERCSTDKGQSICH